jgi:hypothetical protein
MGTLALPLSDIVNVSVIVSPTAVQGPQFNQALIVGNSAVIPSYGANSRARQYSGGLSILQAMLRDGFTLTSPEYLAASFYLAQQPTPYYLWIGRQDTTAIGSYAIHSGGAGTGYKVGDQVTVVQAGASNGVLQVTAIGGSGAVTALSTVQGGTAYSIATNLATTGGSGTGLTIDISSIGESALTATQVCRLASSQWYLFTVLTAVDSDNIALAGWAQTAFPVCQLFYQTSSANVLNASDTTGIFAQLKAAGYNRCIGTYTTTQGGAAPNNAYFSAALMGLAMGRNTGLTNSYFVLPFKTVTGMTVEQLTQTQFNTISATYGNAYCSYASTYNSYAQGYTATGQYFDQILGIDMLVSDLQYDLTNMLFQYPSIAQTDEGQSVLLHAANGACQKSTNRGFLSTGVWTGQTILNLVAGMSVAKGYLNQSPTYASIGGKPSNRAAAPIYCAVVLTEAVQSIVIAVYVQQ